MVVDKLDIWQISDQFRRFVILIRQIQRQRAFDAKWLDESIILNSDSFRPALLLI